MKRRDFLVKSALGTAFGSVSIPLVAMPKNLKIKGTIKENKETSIAGDYDVVVCGAGPAGVSAAIEAARMGAKTLLIEVHGALGGVWTAGLLGWIVDHTQHGGLMDEIREKIAAINGVSPINTGPNFAVDPEKMKLLLEDLCLDANVDLIYHTRVVDVVKNEKNRITHIITESKSGREAWSGKIFIDTTGDGDVAALAGNGFDLGDKLGRTQPMTLLCVVGGPQFSEIEPYIRYIGDEQKRVAKRNLLGLLEQAGIEPSILKPGLFPIKDDLYMLMGNHMHGYSSWNNRDVTKATILARKETHKLVEGLRGIGGAWSKLRLVSTAEQIGTREGRRIHGLYQITTKDITSGAKFKDAVCRVKYSVDVHPLSKEEEKNKASYSHGLKSLPFDVPIRSLIARDVAGLMMAGRCISGDFYAHATYRQTGDAVPMGQSAGRVAAIAVQKNILPQEVNWNDVGISVEDSFSSF